jgi:predicted HTH transcriptional regulator
MAARQEGPNIVQSFFERASRKGGRLHAIVCDVVAFANTNGGTIFIGVSPNLKSPPVGLDRPDEVVATLKAEIQNKVTPPIDVAIDVLESQGKKVLRASVPRGTDIPYTVEGTRIYIRQESETSLALRDEIVQLVGQALPKPPEPPLEEKADSADAEVEAKERLFRIAPPRTGVEIVDSEERKGSIYHTLRDLRNRNVVTNVTRQSARRLWRSAITQHEEAPVAGEKITWQGDVGLWKTYRSGRRTRYNLVQRDKNGKIHYYYGVSEDGFHGEWRQFLKE